MTTNEIVYQARIHWILFLGPLVMLIASAFIGFTYASFYPVALVFGIVSVIWVLMVWMTYQFSSLTIKKKQVILCTGILVRQTIDIPMNKIESIDIKQPILGSILRYGSLRITGTGGTKQMINYLNKPLTCRRYIEQMMHE